ncbi:NUDIX domain-containing protein [Candidatus Woesearchaeota archaeon]|nr:NUDIX domain-containing protein [Candidatus Woesearchaeota archaeon]
MAAEPKISAHESSAGIILYRLLNKKREYLLLQYHYTTSYWGLCKGRIEQNEDPEQTALREAAEETSYTKIELHSRFREKTSYFFLREGKYISKSVLWFCGKVLDTHDGKVSFEHTKLIWLPYEKAIEKLTYDNDKRMVQEAEEFLKNFEKK